MLMLHHCTTVYSQHAVVTGDRGLKQKVVSSMVPIQNFTKKITNYCYNINIKPEREDGYHTPH